MKATTAIVLDTRRAKLNGKFPVKLRITYLRKQKYYVIGFDLTESEFEKANSERPKGKYKELTISLNAIEGKAIDVIGKIPDFSFVQFETNFLKPRLSQHNLNDVFEEYIERLKKEGRIGTASSYECSLNSLKNFTNKISFEHVTIEFLKKYETWMIENGNSVTTVGIYLRALRTIINEAISLNLMRKEQYPFGKRKYQIPSGQNLKKALSIVDIGKIYHYEPPKGTKEELARDIWLFSYLVNGINIKDIARLKYKNIDGNRLKIIRSKTERTTRHNIKPIVAFLISEAKIIIEKWGNKPTNPENYIFPFLPENVSPQREYEIVKQTVKNINKWMRRIAVKLGIEQDVTTYAARHSFSTTLKRSGVSTEYISEALGHSNLKTTESYLDSFEDTVKQEFAEKLLAFPKESS